MTIKTPEIVAESAAVETAIQTIVDTAARNKARDDDECHFFQIKAMTELGYGEPLTPEQRAMNTMLTKLKAGKACCQSAWNIYHKLTA